MDQQDVNSKQIIERINEKENIEKRHWKKFPR